ncbi:hypothetical protein HMPREF9005_2291 [Actinomyces sp. oral taxon 178 str. F0338]|nr:hypothetical protein HMPREF9005_2291 [Actinomyces sp. oral taxon 178 str. F0338]
MARALADVVDHGARFYRLPVLRGAGSPRDERAANRRARPSAGASPHRGRQRRIGVGNSPAPMCVLLPQ